jgi:hypothetical protein
MNKLIFGCYFSLFDLAVIGAVTFLFHQGIVYGSWVEIVIALVLIPMLFPISILMSNLVQSSDE